MKLSSPSRRRAWALVASAGLLTAGLLTSSPATAEPVDDAGPQDRGAKVVDTGHEPKHPLKIKAKRDAQRRPRSRRS